MRPVTWSWWLRLLRKIPSSSCSKVCGLPMHPCSDLTTSGRLHHESSRNRLQVTLMKLLPEAKRKFWNIHSVLRFFCWSCENFKYWIQLEFLCIWGAGYTVQTAAKNLETQIDCLGNRTDYVNRQIACLDRNIDGLESGKGYLDCWATQIFRQAIKISR